MVLHMCCEPLYPQRLLSTRTARMVIALLSLCCCVLHVVVPGEVLVSNLEHAKRTILLKKAPKSAMAFSDGHPLGRPAWCAMAAIVQGGEGGGRFCAGIILWEIFVSKEGGNIFPWRNLGALAVQCVCDTVFGFARVADFSPSDSERLFRVL